MITRNLYEEILEKFEEDNGLLSFSDKTLRKFADEDYASWMKEANFKNEKNGPNDEEKVKEYLNSKLYQMLGNVEWIGDGKETFDFSEPIANFYFQQSRDFAGGQKK